jgi:hypothetical protein
MMRKAGKLQLSAALNPLCRNQTIHYGILKSIILYQNTKYYREQRKIRGYKLFCETNKAPALLNKKFVHQIKTVRKKAILIRDNDDNRYEYRTSMPLERKAEARLKNTLEKI